MKLLLFSDSHHGHGMLVALLRRVKEEEGITAVLFAGDGAGDADAFSGLAPVYKVRGNCDPGELSVPQAMSLAFGPTRVFLTHGNLQRVKMTLALLARDAADAGAGVAVFGHTHRQRADYVSGVLCVNPGALEKGDYALLHLQPDQPPRAELLSLSRGAE